MKYRIIERADGRFCIQHSPFGHTWSGGSDFDPDFATEDEANSALLQSIRPKVVAEFET